MNCNGFILSAGLGTRLRPLTNTIPKPLIEVAGKPAIFYALEALKKAQVKSVVINTHHLAGKIKKTVGLSWQGMDIKFSHERELLGTAGGFKKGSKLFSKPLTTVILSSDVIFNADLKKIIAYHHRKKSMFTIAVKLRRDVTGSGIAQFDKSEKIIKFKEKPSPNEVFSHYINCSIYIAEPMIYDIISSGFSDFSRDIFPKLIEKKVPFYAYKLPPMENYLLGIDTPQLLKKVEADILCGKVFYAKK